METAGRLAGKLTNMSLRAIRFTKSPTGKFKLGYSAGQIGYVTADLYEQIIAEGFGEPVTEKESEAKAPEICTTVDPAPKEAEKAVSKTKRGRPRKKSTKKGN